MTPWDIRAFLRAFGAALLGLVIVGLVTAVSDEGHLALSVRVGRTLPLAPFCSAVGAALALGTSRVRHEARAFEALGRSPAETSRAAALGAALPAILIALAIGGIPSLDVGAFYPRAATSDTFVLGVAGFESPTLGIRVDDEGETRALEVTSHVVDEGLPRGARLVASVATGIAGLALAGLSARAAIGRSLLDSKARRRMRVLAIGEVLGCALLTLVAFQAAAARLTPAGLAVLPSLALLISTFLRLRWSGRRQAWSTP